MLASFYIQLAKVLDLLSRRKNDGLGLWTEQGQTVLSTAARQWAVHLART